MRLKNFAKAIDPRLTTIDGGFAGRYEGTKVDIRRRLHALEELARAARPPQPQPQQQPPSNYDIGSPSADAANRPEPEGFRRNAIAKDHPQRSGRAGSQSPGTATGPSGWWTAAGRSLPAQRATDGTRAGAGHATTTASMAGPTSAATTSATAGVQHTAASGSS